MIFDIADKLYNSVCLAGLPVVVTTIDEFHDTLMDLALECRRCSDELSNYEKVIFDRNNEKIILLVGKKIGLIT